MTVMDAINIAEGFTPVKSESKYNRAWQLLIDTGICWQLQGWFGRRAAAMIEAGICTAAGRTH